MTETLYSPELATSTFDSADLELIARVSLSRSDEPARLTLTGVYLAPAADGYWHAYATTGKILAVARLSLKAEPHDKPALLSPETLTAIKAATKTPKRALLARLEVFNTHARSVKLAILGTGEQFFKLSELSYPNMKFLNDSLAEPLWRTSPMHADPALLSLAYTILTPRSKDSQASTVVIASGPHTMGWIPSPHAETIAVALMPLVHRDAKQKAQFSAAWNYFPTADDSQKSAISIALGNYAETGERPRSEVRSSPDEAINMKGNHEMHSRPQVKDWRLRRP